MNGIRSKFAQENTDFCIRRSGSLNHVELKFIKKMVNVSKIRELYTDEYNKVQVIATSLGKM
jgi:hypothetical protein